MINVLIIDDDSIDVLALRKSFNKNEIMRHACLHEAKNGKEALALLTGIHPLKPTLVILDINMPGMNGLQFLDIIRASPNLSNLRVIVLTTSADQSDIQAANSKCIVGYITKSKAGNYSDLVDLISKYCTLTET